MRYRVTFETPWGTNAIPAGFPSDPHTGNMFLVVHGPGYRLFREGRLASVGIANTAMYGTVDDLVEEARVNPSVSRIYTSRELHAPGEQSFRVEVDRDHPTVSFVTMIAPSPDWFTGVSSVGLQDAARDWVKSVRVPLTAYDAGTDAGEEFLNKPDYPQIPPLPITPIGPGGVLFPRGRVSPIGVLTVERIY